MALSRFVHADIGRFKPAPRAPASPPALPSIGSLSVYGMAPSLDSLRSSLGSVDASARELLLGALSLAQVSETAIDDRALMRNGQLVFRLEERALRASFRAPYKMLFTKPKSSILRVQTVPCSPSFSPPCAPTDEYTAERSTRRGCPSASSTAPRARACSTCRPTASSPATTATA